MGGRTCGPLFRELVRNAVVRGMYGGCYPLAHTFHYFAVQQRRSTISLETHGKTDARIIYGTTPSLTARDTAPPFPSLYTHTHSCYVPALDCTLDKEQQTKQDSRIFNKKRTGQGPLNVRAQERFDAGPAPSDTRGHLYIYYEADGAFTSGTSRADSNARGSHSGVREWKIGKTTRDRPERRMKQSAARNGKIYKLRASWEVPWCGFVEKVVHLDFRGPACGARKRNGQRKKRGWGYGVVSC